MTDRNHNKRQGAQAVALNMPRLTKGRLLVMLGFLFGGFIVLNALVFQTEKHPAPLFKPVAKAPEIFPVPPLRSDGQSARHAAFDPKPVSNGKMAPLDKPASPDKSKPAQLSAPAAHAVAPLETSEAMLSEIQRELGKRGYYKGEPDGKPGKATSQAIRDFQFAQRLPADGKPSEALLKDVMASKVTMKDELFDLVKRTAQDDKANKVNLANKTIQDVQRALNKAGYGPLDEDGQMGKSTKTALAKFEQDKKLPPKGEPKGPVLRALASASGVSIAQ